MDINQMSFFDMPKKVVIDVVDKTNNTTKKHTNRFYHFTHNVGQNGLVAKFNNNYAAIRLVKEIAETPRDLTSDEQRILTEYVGWGAMSELVFPTNKDKLKPAWRKRSNDIHALLNDDELKQAMKSTLNAHYTSTTVIDAMWRGLQIMGFTGGRILEPALGPGHFIGRMPRIIARVSNITGIELESIPAQIAQLLYPCARIINAGYETFTDTRGFDLGISNVPFGKYKVYDPDIFQNSRSHLKKSSIHDYFFIKAIDQIREGGLLAFITSRYTMDKADKTIRKYISERMTLLRAIRLPVDAFKKNAGTQTTMDILFFIKHPDPVPGWLDTKVFSTAIHTDGKPRKLYINSYYDTHPEYMIGEMKEVGGKFAEAIECIGSPGWETDLLEAMEELPSDVYKSAPRALFTGFTEQQEFTPDPELTWLREGSYALDDREVIWQMFNGEWIKPTFKQKHRIPKVRGLIKVRNTFRFLLNANLNNETDNVLRGLQADLARVYKEFTWRDGPLNAHANIGLINNTLDPDFLPMLAIETWDNVREIATKADIFTKRIRLNYVSVVMPNNAAEALDMALNEYGYVNFGYMSELLNDETEENIIRDLGERIYLDPAMNAKTNGGHRWVTSNRYLSGNVRVKLTKAESAGLECNVQALRPLIPADIEPKELIIKFGATHVPAKYVNQFVDEVIWEGTRTGLNYYYGKEDPEDKHTAWHLNKKDLHWSVKRSATNTEKWGTSRVEAIKLILKTLNKRTQLVFDYEGESRVKNDKETLACQIIQDRIKEAWEEWWATDDDRASAIARIHNDLFNSEIEGDHDSTMLTFPGMNAAITLRDHQRNVIWRIIENRNTLMAHAVGFGKTFALIAAAMTAKRMGICNKPVLVVKKSTFPQIVASAYLLYPAANILAVSSMPSNRRKYFTGRMAVENPDLIVMTHEIHKLLQLDPMLTSEFYTKQLAEIEGELLASFKAKDDDLKRKILEIKKEAVLLKMKLLADKAGKKDEALYYNELGFDMIMYDESQRLKNLYFFTQMQVAGVGGTESGVAFDSYSKFRWMQENNPNSKLIFSTGTPIENTLGEMFTLMRFMMYDELERIGLEQFDTWASVFTGVVTAVEMTPDGGGFRMKDRLVEFNNVPELIRMFRSFADVQMDIEKVGLNVPDVVGGQAVGVSSPQSKVQAMITKTLVHRAAHVDPKDLQGDNMLMIITLARKCALDPRLCGVVWEVDKKGQQTDQIIHATEDQPESKTNMMIKKLLHFYHNPLGEDGLTQVVFVDMYKSGDYNVGQDIWRKLMEGGIPEKEIAFAQDQTTDVQKAKFQQDMRDGKIRVGIGSTQTLGIGVNVQDRLIAMHNLDIPWKPAEMEQRIGRIVRQGNLNDQVYIFNYLAEKSFDVFMYETNERKAQFIKQIFQGEGAARSMEDVGDGAKIDYQEFAALASGNPLVLEQVKLKADVAKLKILDQAHHDSMKRTIRELNFINVDINRYKRGLTQYEDMISRVEEETETPLVTLSQTLKPVCENLPLGERTEVAELYGMKIYYNSRPDIRRACTGLKVDWQAIAVTTKVLNAVAAGQYKSSVDYIIQTIILNAVGGEEMIDYKSHVEIETQRGEISFPLHLGKKDHVEKNLKRLISILGLEALNKKKGELLKKIQKMKTQRRGYQQIVDVPFQFETKLSEAVIRLSQINVEMSDLAK